MHSIGQSNFNCLCRSKSFTPHFPKFYSSAATRKADNQFYTLGEAKFLNGVTVPFYGVTAQNPMEDGLLKDFENARLKAAVLIFNSMLNMPSNSSFLHYLKQV